ncbi:uncharacterized protein [Rutidosis leptorrhynchoides]|uniref:uncharacterized protein n=1 Tax=Rutidosis leptorrhynchoides TaxID=125765 RepID=UPI003A9A5574
MQFMGFGLKWIGFIRACLSSSSISVLINGSPTKEFSPKRGIRQGDPISPFLYIIVAEGLNILVKRALANGHLQGLNIEHDNLIITHLQYADDTIFFGEWNKRNAKYISKLLKCFKNILSLKVNFRKSKLYGIGTSMTETEQMAYYIKCSAGSTPFTYLGLPIGVPTSHASSWNISGHTIWKEIIKAGKVADNIGTSFTSSISKRIGNGTSISFWHNIWIRSESLKSSFQRLFMLESHKEATVADRILNVNSTSIENWDWSRPPSGRAMDELTELNNLITSVNISDCPDSWKFSLDASGIYTTSTMSNLIITLKYGTNSRNLSLPRNKYVPQKIFIFSWRVVQLKIPVRSELDKQGIDLHTILCPLCEHHIETIDHALVNCQKVSSIWIQLLDWWNQNSIRISNINEAIISDKGFTHNSIG